MKPRKTFPVAEFKKNLNRQLRLSITNPDFRFGLITMAETVLMNTGNYHGFTYLDKDEVPAGELPGYNKDVEDYNERFANTDESRRYYF